MSDEIFTRNGIASMAYVGEKPWHQLGQELTPGASVDTWIDEAGLNYDVLGQVVNFQDPQGNMMPFGTRKVLVRSDTLAPLEVVAKDYKIVQPKEIIEIFRGFVEAGNMSLETAGVLKGGNKIWGLARIGKDLDAGDGDMVQNYLLLATSYDKSLSTTGQLTSVRVVCNNTLSFAINRGKSGKEQSIRIPHNQKFDSEKVKNKLGLIKETIDENAQIIQKLHKTTVSHDEAIAFFTHLLCTPKERKSGEVDIGSKARSMAKLWESYQHAPGREDSAWGLVNAVTYAVDHNTSARSDDTRLDSAWFGHGARQKTEAYQLAQDTDFLDAIISKTAATNAVDRILEKVAV